MDEQVDKIPEVVVLAGTTASGKTDVSIPLAQRLGAEIINADSRQVYRELRIGSAPPSKAQLDAVKHHFVASKSISERWTAGDFAREARQVINDRCSFGRRTLVVGGSMLYLRALIDGLYTVDDEPLIDYLALRREWERRGAEEMLRELQSIDADIAGKTRVNDYHRVMRAIGVYRATGYRLSELRSRPTTALTARFRMFFLYGDRTETYARVNERVDRMLEAGLVDEVKGLWQNGYDESNTNALRTHGYQEVFPFLRGEYDFGVMRDKIKQAVRHYVKRQLTWYRNDARVQKVERSFADSADEIAIRIYSELNE
ncbi:tRNA (adenosine(37)-N6)-dimethylallyltransferase MiaA [bacterium]|nr:tRNA (adenosine(37)-N6)-dimethylallyltransferase MiaA [bacterium]